MREEIKNIVGEHCSPKKITKKSKKININNITSCMVLFGLIISNCDKKFITIASVCAGAWIVHDSPLLFSIASISTLYIMMTSISCDNSNNLFIKAFVSSFVCLILLFKNFWIGLIVSLYPLVTIKEAYEVYNLEKKLSEDVKMNTKQKID